MAIAFPSGYYGLRTQNDLVKALRRQWRVVPGIAGLKIVGFVDGRERGLLGVKEMNHDISFS
jgi:hypothetical protein